MSKQMSVIKFNTPIKVNAGGQVQWSRIDWLNIQAGSGREANWCQEGCTLYTIR